MMKQDMDLVFSVHISEQKTLLEAILFCGTCSSELFGWVRGKLYKCRTQVLYRIIFLTDKGEINEFVHTIQLNSDTLVFTILFLFSQKRMYRLCPIIWACLLAIDSHVKYDVLT